MKVGHYLEDSEKALPERVKITSWFRLCRVEIEFPAKNLHTKKRKNNNKQEKK